MTGTYLYLNLMKLCLTRMLFPDCCVDLELQPTGCFNLEDRRHGRDWPSEADTMIGLKRLENLEACALQAIESGVPGDFVETGVWRGGASIFMRAVLKALGETDRLVWVADSFAGMPVPDALSYPADADDKLFKYNAFLGVSLETVKANFAKYDLLDEQVRFLQGWFKDTLPGAPIERISLLRLDGDMYESTMHVLNHLYWKVSPGGFVVVDDYGALAKCRAAIHDFRDRHEITEEIIPADWTGVYWRKRDLGDGAVRFRLEHGGRAIDAAGR